MICNKAKVCCLIVFALTLSGCGSSSGDGADIIDSQTIFDDAINADGSTTAEVTVSMEASNSIATPVPTVSSFEMDAFIENPLTAPVPAELREGSPISVTRNYIINPLIN